MENPLVYKCQALAPDLVRPRPSVKESDPAERDSDYEEICLQDTIVVTFCPAAGGLKNNSMLDFPSVMANFRKS